MQADGVAAVGDGELVGEIVPFSNAKRRLGIRLINGLGRGVRHAARADRAADRARRVACIDRVSGPVIDRSAARIEQRDGALARQSRRAPIDRDLLAHLQLVVGAGCNHLHDLRASGRRAGRVAIAADLDPVAVGRGLCEVRIGRVSAIDHCRARQDVEIIIETAIDAVDHVVAQNAIGAGRTDKLRIGDEAVLVLTGLVKPACQVGEVAGLPIAEFGGAAGVKIVVVALEIAFRASRDEDVVARLGPQQVVANGGVRHAAARDAGIAFEAKRIARRLIDCVVDDLIVLCDRGYVDADTAVGINDVIGGENRGRAEQTRQNQAEGIAIRNISFCRARGDNPRMSIVIGAVADHKIAGDTVVVVIDRVAADFRAGAPDANLLVARMPIHRVAGHQERAWTATGDNADAGVVMHAVVADRAGAVQLEGVAASIDLIAADRNSLAGGRDNGAAVVNAIVGDGDIIGIRDVDAGALAEKALPGEPVERAAGNGSAIVRCSEIHAVEIIAIDHGIADHQASALRSIGRIDAAGSVGDLQMVERDVGRVDQLEAVTRVSAVVTIEERDAAGRSFDSQAAVGSRENDVG